MSAALILTVAACAAASTDRASAPSLTQAGRGSWRDCRELTGAELARRGWSDIGVRRCDAAGEWLLLLSNDRAAYPMIEWNGHVWSTIDVNERHMPPGEVPEVTRHAYAWARSRDGHSVVLAYVVEATVLEGDTRPPPRAFVVAATPETACLVATPERRVSMTAEEALSRAGAMPSCPPGAERLARFPRR